MNEFSFPQLVVSVNETRKAYHKLTIIVGPAGSGKTRLLKQLAGTLRLPTLNFGLHFSQRLLDLTRRQRALKSEDIAIDVIEEHLQSGLCLDDTELLFDSTLRLNPITFLQEVSRNRLLVATWNGTLTAGELRFAYPGHPDFFSQAVSGYPVISIAEDKLHLYLTT